MSDTAPRNPVSAPQRLADALLPRRHAQAAPQLERGWLFHYPRLQSMAAAEEAALPLAAKQGTQARIALKAHFLALPVTDPLDGERVLCYRSFLPAPNALI